MLVTQFSLHYKIYAYTLSSVIHIDIIYLKYIENITTIAQEALSSI